MSASGQPFWFGAPAAPLFGWYHGTPQDGTGAGAARDLAVVICPPFGYEAICAHRGLGALADQLSGAGLPTVRFDYHGTGDSAGDDAQPDRVSSWLASIAAAIDQAKARSGRSQVALVGLRLGALLAASAAAGRDDVRALVLWAPAISGKAFLREMKMLRLAGEGEAGVAPEPASLGRNAGDEEAGGFLLSEPTMESLRALNLLAFDRRPAQTVLIVPRDDVPDDNRLTKRLLGLGVIAREEKIPGYSALMQAPHQSVRPQQALAAIGAFLIDASHPFAAPAPAATTAETASAPIPFADADVSGVVREEAVAFTVGGVTLRGILCVPAAGHGYNGPGAPAARGGVVMLNAGAIRRIGPNRLYVQLARTWALRGVASLRVDLSGLGDSDGQDPVGARLYSMISVPEAQGAVQALRESQGFPAVTVMGLCSGAFVAFHAALADGAINRTVLINPQLFFWKEGTCLDVARRDSYQASRHYRQSMFRKESWAKLLRGEVDVARMARLLGTRVVDVARDQVSPLLELVRAPDDEVLTALRATIARRVTTHLVFCTGDPGLDNIQAHLGRGLRRLGTPGTLKGRVTMDTVDGPDHTFTPVWSHRVLIDLLTRRVTQP